jgi:hypothetical protein
MYELTCINMKSVKPCVQACLPFSSIRKEEIMLTCLRIRHNCLTHKHLLQGVHTQRGVHIYISCRTYVLKNAKYFHGDRILHYTLWDNWHGFVHGISALRPLNWISSILLFDSIHIYVYIVSRILLGLVEPVLLSFLNSAFIVSSNALVHF